MTISIQWISRTLASGMHAAYLIATRSPLLEAKLHDAFGEAAGRLQTCLTAANLPEDLLWSHLMGLSLDNNPAEVVQVALRKSVGLEAASSSIARDVHSCVREIDRTAQQLWPKHAEEMELRTAPIRQQWEARGPGMMRVIAGLTNDSTLVDTAKVAVVQPVSGGGGEPHLRYNSARIEGLLANPDESLPEVVRLAWLLSQLNLDLPVMSDYVNAHRLPQVAKVAMLPAVLLAAERVELAKFDRTTAELALDAWRIEGSGDLVEIAFNWWETYASERRPLSVALGALSQMLP